MHIIRDTTASNITELTKVCNAPTQLHRYLSEADGEGIRFLVYEQDKEIRGFAMLFLRQPSQDSTQVAYPEDQRFVLGAALSFDDGSLTLLRQ